LARVRDSEGIITYVLAGFSDKSYLALLSLIASRLVRTGQQRLNMTVLREDIDDLFASLARLADLTLIERKVLLHSRTYCPHAQHNQIDSAVLDRIQVLNDVEVPVQKTNAAKEKARREIEAAKAAKANPLKEGRKKTILRRGTRTKPTRMVALILQPNPALQRPKATNQKLQILQTQLKQVESLRRRKRKFSPTLIGRQTRRRKGR